MKYFYHLATHRYFDQFILCCIICNTLVLANVWYDQDPRIVHINNIINFVFAGIFTIELIIKLIAFGQRFFMQLSNKFDAFIVFGTALGIILS